jgi:hypothetical protein
MQHPLWDQLLSAGKAAEYRGFVMLDRCQQAHGKHGKECHGIQPEIVYWPDRPFYHPQRHSSQDRLARLRGLGHFRGFGPLKINELVKKVFTTAGAGARATEWNLGRDLDIADQRELAEGACERQSDTFRISWQ